MKRNYQSGSIKKALLIIECVGKSPKPLKASQVANLTKLDRATAFRILTYLNSLGYRLFDSSNIKMLRKSARKFKFKKIYNSSDWINSEKGQLIFGDYSLNTFIKSHTQIQYFTIKNYLIF